MPTEIEIKQVVADILREWEEAVLEHEQKITATA